MATIKARDRAYRQRRTYRLGTRSTIVTSQLPVKKWHETIGNPTLADTVLDRLVHNSYRIELTGDSQRQRRVPALTEHDPISP